MKKKNLLNLEEAINLKDQLITTRDQYVDNANRQIANLNGRIDLLTIIIEQGDEFEEAVGRKSTD